MSRLIVIAGSLMAGWGVALGAFGAHALKPGFTDQQAEWWSTGVDYQMWHGLALLLVAALPLHRKRLAASLIGGGALLFAATLYLMALGFPRWLGAVTPIGGAAMIAGWLVIAWSARPTPPASES